MNGRPTARTRKVRPSRHRTPGGGVEALEPRQLLATFTVTNTGDLTNTGAVVPGSLRDAINKANQSPGADLINFNIGGTGLHTIVISPPPQPNPPGPQPLPAIIDQVTIDGTTQQGYNGRPVIEIDGEFAGNGANGLRIAASNTIIKGLAINRFTSAGIAIESTGDQVYGCFIGTDSTGTIDEGNKGAGILIDGQSSNTIGGTASGQQNLISGNDADGVLIDNGSQNNILINNLIGTTLSGSTALPNSNAGVEINNASQNRIGQQNLIGTGGTAVPQGNTISGNLGAGVLITGAGSTTNTVQGNFIGTDPAGRNPVGNGGNGVSIEQGARRARSAASPQPAGRGTSSSAATGVAGILLLNGPNTLIQGNFTSAPTSIGAGRPGQRRRPASSSTVRHRLDDRRGGRHRSRQRDRLQRQAQPSAAPTNGRAALHDRASGTGIPIQVELDLLEQRPGDRLWPCRGPTRPTTSRPTRRGARRPGRTTSRPIRSSPQAVTGAGRTLIQGVLERGADGHLHDPVLLERRRRPVRLRRGADADRPDECDDRRQRPGDHQSGSCRLRRRSASSSRWRSADARRRRTTRPEFSQARADRPGEDRQPVRLGQRQPEPGDARRAADLHGDGREQRPRPGDRRDPGRHLPVFDPVPVGDRLAGELPSRGPPRSRRQPRDGSPRAPRRR